MFLLSRRQVHAALAGAAAAATWLAAAEIGSRKPVKVGALFLLSSAALAAMVGQGTGNRASVKATVTEQRLNQFLASGGLIGGDLHVATDHYVAGTTHMQGPGELAATLHFNNNNIDGLNNVNLDHTPIAFNGVLWMNGYDIHMQGGTIHP